MPESILIHAVHRMRRRRAPSSSSSCSKLCTISSKRSRAAIASCSAREHAFEQQDAVGQSRGTQREAFVEPRDREAVGFRERLGGRHEAVAVGIRLDHGHDAAVGRGLAHLAQVVAQRGGVDDGADEARAGLHGSMACQYCGPLS